MKPVAALPYRKFLLLFSTVTVVTFIFAHSLMPAAVSDGTSERVYAFFVPWLEGLPFYSHAFLRQLAHFCEYALLGLHAPFYRILWRKGDASFAIFSAFAMLDEGLQSLVPGRVPDWQDVIVDLGGLVTGCLIAVLFLVVWYGRRKREKQ